MVRGIIDSIHRRLPPSIRQSLRVAAREVATISAQRDLGSVVRMVRPYTMVPDDALLALGRQVRAVIAEGIEGDVVECGVWRGGASFLMAEVVRESGAKKRVWLFDSFEGLPPPQDIDGSRAMAYSREVDAPGYFDNCRAALEEVRQAAQKLGLSERTELVPGWFDASLPATRERVGAIALLRIDADWYSSVKCCLENLYDQVSPGGYVVFDDYDAWEGCRIAVHEFLGSRRLAHRIAHDGCAYFRKS